MGRLVKWTGWAAVVLFLLALFTVIFLLFPGVQTWIAGRMSAYAHKELGINFSVRRVAVHPFGPIHFQGLYIADLQGDTLIAADDLAVRGLRIELDGRTIRARSLGLDHARFFLEKAEGDSTSNLTQLLNKLSSRPTDAPAAPWTISCGTVDVRAFHFSYHDRNVPVAPYGVDFEHVDARRVHLLANGLRVVGDTISASLEGVSLIERSGLVLDALTGRTSVSPKGVRIDDLTLRTPRTDLHGQLALNSDGWEDFDEFIDSIQIRLDLDSSRLQFADIAWFAPDLKGIDFPIDVSGRFRGTIRELHGKDMHLGFGQRSVFEGDASLSGLPDINTTFIVLDVEHFRTDPADLATLPVPPFDSLQTLQLPVEVQRLGAMSFEGNFTGFPNAFTAYGRSSTDIGTVRTDLSYERDTVSRVFSFNGRLATDGFDLGRLINDPTVGPLACNVTMKAHGGSVKTMEADIEGTVPLLTFNRYRITNIETRARLDRDRFNGELHCRDPNLVMDFNGLADRSGRWPKVDFTANIQHADLHALNLVEGEGYNSLSVIVQAEGEIAPDSLKGTLLLDDVSYCDAQGDHEFGDIQFHSTRSGGQPVIELRSTLADATVRGPFLPTKLPDALRSVVLSVFPSLEEQVRYAHAEQHFDFDLELKEMGPVLDMFLPELELAPGTEAHGSFDSRTFDLGLAASIPHIAYGGFSGDTVHVIADKTMDVLAFSFRSARQALSDSTWIRGIDITGKAYQDEVELSMGWSGSSYGTEGDLELLALVNGPRSIDADLLPSTLFFGRGILVTIRATAHFRWDSTHVRVDSLELWNGIQHLLLNGFVGRDPQESLRFDLENVRMENLQPLPGRTSHPWQAWNGDGRVFASARRSPTSSATCAWTVSRSRTNRSATCASRPPGTKTDDAIDLNGTLDRAAHQGAGFHRQCSAGEGGRNWMCA